MSTTTPVAGAEIKIGAKLRRARRERQLSLEQVANAANLTKGFISQVERDLTSVSVASLVKICNAIGLRIGSLFDPSPRHLVRQADRLPINFGGQGVVEHLLTPTGQERIQVIESHVSPGGGSGDEAYALSGDAEFVHVIRGELEVEVRGDRYVLREGDSFTFSPRDPHSWCNRSLEETLVLWVLTPSPW
jgi:transcriptional regulator with XRE-family HTH domain